MLAAWRLALGTLTVVRVRPPGRVDREVARSAMLLAPLAVLPLALAVAAVTWLAAEAGLPALAVGLLGVAVLVLGTRALHVDGLSDTADGLTASYDRERSLAVMRTGTSGPAGGAAVLLVLGLQAACLGALVHDLRSAVLAGAVVMASRCALVLTCASGVPGARARGEGLGDTFAGTVPVAAAVGAWLAAGGLLGLGVALQQDGEAWRGVGAAVLAVLAVLALVHRVVRRLGGVTGDVYGAAIELALVALLLGVA